MYTSIYVYIYIYIQSAPLNKLFRSKSKTSAMNHTEKCHFTSKPHNSKNLFKIHFNIIILSAQQLLLQHDWGKG